ncbi:VOC family protein [Roseovarius nanhaiticus]|uniref:VOC family protein n=1 Tax=Roseovarius nanhaiticus TaxID=573024 RepID=UPI002490B258|nr:VOC family protein [Roseovarius nanhaiticus]
MAMPQPPEAVLETALYAENLEETAVFYKDIIGLEEEVRADGRHIFLRCKTSMILLFDPEATQDSSGKFPVPPHGAKGEGHVCFRAGPDDLDAWAAHFAARNVEIEADFEWPNGARSIYVRDPARNSVEFAEAKLWGFDA